MQVQMGQEDNIQSPHPPIPQEQIDKWHNISIQNECIHLLEDFKILIGHRFQVAGFGAFPILAQLLVGLEEAGGQ